MENKKKKILIAIGIIIAILSVVGVSYAVWIFTATQSEKNLIKLDCFDIAFEEITEGVSLQNTFPLKDSEGQALKPYHFKVINKCENYANFVVRLEVKKTATLDDKYIKVMLNNYTPKVLINQNYEETHELLGKETNIGYILDNGFLDVNETKDYDLRLWLDESVTLNSRNDDGSEVQRSNWGGIITVSASYLGDNHTTLAGKNIPIVTSGDGLYKVTHAEITEITDNEEFKKAEYRFAGKNPNNYVEFNNELWRIIGLVNVKTTNGVEQRLKIIKNESIGTYSWDHKSNGTGSSTSEYGSNDWTDSQLMSMLNGIYYESSSGECWTGNSDDNSSKDECRFDGTDVKTNNSKGLTTSAKTMIDETIIWNIGGWNTNVVKTEEMYGHERGTTVFQTNPPRPTEWSQSNTASGTTYHSIGLMYASEVGVHICSQISEL